MSKISYVPAIQYDRKIHRKVSTIVGSELSNLGKVCYYPKMVRYFEDLISELQLTNEDIKRFKETNIGKRYSSFSILNDKQTLMLVIAIIYFARRKQLDVSELFFLFLAVKLHSNLMHKHFKFCQPDAYAMALERISHKHLYKVKGGIPSAIKYVSDTEFKKYRIVLGSNRLTDDSIVKMVYALRTRLSQSIKSFAETYYKITEEGGGHTTSEDVEDKLERIADKIAMTMCTYGQVDKGAVSSAILKSGIRKELGLTIASEMSDPDYKDSIRFIIILIHRLSSIKNICSESKRLLIVRKIESGQKVGNYAIRERILELINGLPSAYSLKTTHKSQVVMFVSHYLTLYIQRRVC